MIIDHAEVIIFVVVGNFGYDDMIVLPSVSLGATALVSFLLLMALNDWIKFLYEKMSLMHF